MATKKSSSKKRSSKTSPKRAATKKSTSKKKSKRTPPRPKHTANLPAGLAKYWAARGVPK